ncbi:MAG: DUF1189 family protein, partial [Candidatus Obscuribacterales bacterium]|nr:DUF1189 family protein [Candidatus Obscuribacterales bacterium]
PEMKLSDGKISTLESRVLAFRLPAYSENLLVIDPKNTIKSFEDAHARVLLQEEKFLLLLPSGSPVTLGYKRFFPDGIYRAAELQARFLGLVQASLVPLGIFVLLSNFSFCLIKSIVLALLLKIFKLKLRFLTLVRLLIVSCSPASLLSGLMIFSNLRFEKIEGPLFFVISSAYIILSLSAQRTKSGPESAESGSVSS